MKRVLVVVLLSLLMGGSFAVAGQYGPAQPLMKKGQFSLGPGYFRYSADWVDPDGTARQNMAYAQAGYGITDNWEIYAQLGAADLEVESIFDSGDFDDGYLPFGSFGFRALLADRKPLAMGIFGQGSYFFDTWEDTGTVNGASVKLEFDQSYELSAGISLQTEIEGAYLYFGPFLFVREGDVSVSGAISDSDTFEEDGNFGGFVGIRWPLKNGVNIELEGQVRSKFSAGGSIQYVF